MHFVNVCGDRDIVLEGPSLKGKPEGLPVIWPDGNVKIGIAKVHCCNRMHLGLEGGGRK